eukprot:Pgem_evm5s19777
MDFRNEDFVIDFDQVPSESPGNGGLVQAQSVGNNPVLNLANMAVTKFTLQPCAINLPHVHPRATEMIYVISGSKLRTGFVEENSGRVIINDITNDTTTFFPQGLIHYQQNMGCDPIEFVSMLNNEDPGVQTITTQLFQFPIEALVASFDVSKFIIRKLTRKIPLNIAVSRCRKKCNISES